MSNIGTIELPPSWDHQAHEAERRAAWERSAIHHYDPDGPGEIFAVDTPPPYVSAAHLHVGHAMSYTQAEFVVRYQRMCGRRVFYPMGFDDNGLPTERHVEQVRGIDRSSTTRTAFRAACLEETSRGAVTYEGLWRALGLSVDWALRYSTIDPHCQRTAQWSFIDLYRRGHLRRATEPVTWDPVSQTALAQADLEGITRRTKLHTLSFRATDGRPLPIATTRPELLPACVALYHHPDDPRWTGLSEAEVPLFGRAVPIRTDPDVDPTFGTGLMMVCTFGDAEDVRRWRRDALPMRIVIGPDGRLTDAAGPYAGLETARARDRIVADLASAGVYGGFTMSEQTVPTAERSGAPVEWLAVPQWFVKVVAQRDVLRRRSAELRWYPSFMQERLDQSIDGLQWDWNISRQRYYGVPFPPVWFCVDCGEVVLADPSRLPVDPLEDPPPVSACPACGGALRGDPDVMDTWMTSSLTPLVNSNRVGTPDRAAGPHPMTVRVQAFEIIRTWLFYTLVKSELHCGSLPFRDVMISGWGLDEQGHKISKRNLVPSADGTSRYDPAWLIERYGADALRHWAGRAALGRDLRFSEKDVRAGRKVVVKLWNASRLVAELLVDFDPEAPRPELAGRPPEDRAVVHTFDRVLETVATGLAGYDYASGLAALDRWFFGTFCDDWLEACKDRIRRAGQFPDGSRAAAQATAWEVLRATLGAYAPYLPFVTDTVWEALYRRFEGGPSLHTTTFPSPRGAPEVPEMALVDDVRAAVRRCRTERALPQSREVELLVIRAAPAAVGILESLEPTLRAACRATRIRIDIGETLTVEPTFGPRPVATDPG